MTLQTLAWSLGQVLIHYNPVNGYYGVSSIGQLDTTQLMYPAAALVPSGDMTMRRGLNQYSLTFYVLDRLLTDGSNDFDVYSFSMETLKNFFKQLRLLPGVVALTDEPTIRLFTTERGNDRICGAYSTVDLTVADDAPCADWLDYFGDRTPDLNPAPTPTPTPTPPTPDTGSTPDSGTTPDSGSTPDSGTTPDTGSTPGTGTTPDTGGTIGPDSGTTPDSGVTIPLPETVEINGYRFDPITALTQLRSDETYVFFDPIKKVINCNRDAGNVDGEVFTGEWKDRYFLFSAHTSGDTFYLTTNDGETELYFINDIVWSGETDEDITETMTGQMLLWFDEYGRVRREAAWAPDFNYCEVYLDSNYATPPVDTYTLQSRLITESGVIDEEYYTYAYLYKATPNN